MKKKILFFIILLFVINGCASLKKSKKNDAELLADRFNIINLSDDFAEFEKIELSEYENRKSSARVKFHMSNLNFNNGDYENAKKYISQAINIYPRNGYYHFKLAEIYSIFNESVKAIKYYLNALILEPENAETYFKIGKLYLHQNRAQQSLNYLIKAFNLKNSNISQNTEFLFYLANAYFLNKKYENALFYYNQSYNEYQDNPALLYNMGLCNFMLNKFDAAEEQFEKLLQIDEFYFEAYLQLMQIYSLKNKIDESNQLFNKFLTLDFNAQPSKKKDLFITKAGLYFAQNERLLPAISAFENLSAKYPQNKNVAFMLSKLYFYNENFDSALPLLNNLMSNSPEMPEPYIFTGYLYQSKLAFGRAAQYFEKALKLRPKLPELWLMYASSLSKNKQDTDALKILETAVKDYKIKTPDIYYYLGYLGAAVKDHEKTFFYYEKMIEEFSDYADAHVYNYVGYTYLEKNINFDSAYIFISRAVNEKPNNPYYLDSLGWYYFLKDDIENAYQTFKKIDLQNIQDTIIYEHFGDILAQRGDIVKAVEWYEKAYHIENREILQKKINQIK